MPKSKRDSLLSELDVAGMLGANNKPERPFPIDPWIIPGQVELVEDGAGGRLVWEFGASEGARDRETIDDRETLVRFQALATAPDCEVLEFARTFGPLYLCQHGRPISHSTPVGESYGIGTISQEVAGEDLAEALSALMPGPTTDASEGRCYLVKSEPLRVWRARAKEIRSVLRITAELHRTRRDPEQVIGTPELWEEALPSHSFSAQLIRAGWSGRTPVRKEAVQYVAQRADGLLRETGVRLRLTWPDPLAGPKITYDGLGVLGAVARQLAFTVIRDDGHLICDMCGRLFFPGRKSQIRCGREECKREAGRRDTQRSRARKRKATRE